MAVGAFVEPLVVVTLLFGGAWINRNTDDYDASLQQSWTAWARVDGNSKKSDELDDRDRRRASQESVISADFARGRPSSLYERPPVRLRTLRLLGHQMTITTPDTVIFKDRVLSRVLRKFPFLVEAWYWALIYWIYQMGRAVTALTLVEGTADTARRHALQVIHLEQRLHMFWELPIQAFFLRRPTLMHWINRTYSFIHIPGTIFFLVALFYCTTTRRRRATAAASTAAASGDNIGGGPALYEARRRTMAMCNLIAFVVFTIWPCMPPRLLSDPDHQGDGIDEATSYAFVDTVHGAEGESSVWTTNRFCNQYAAMPSLHFGYSLLIGLTVATFPMPGVRPTSWRRISVAALGMSYPVLILMAIVATANHFILDAVAGALVCGAAWNANAVLLNLSAAEDYFLWMLRIHKPESFETVEIVTEREMKEGEMSLV